MTEYVDFEPGLVQALTEREDGQVCLRSSCPLCRVVWLWLAQV